MKKTVSTWIKQMKAQRTSFIRAKNKRYSLSDENFQTTLLRRSWKMSLQSKREISRLKMLIDWSTCILKLWSFMKGKIRINSSDLRIELVDCWWNHKFLQKCKIQISKMLSWKKVQKWRKWILKSKHFHKLMLIKRRFCINIRIHKNKWRRLLTRTSVIKQILWNKD